MKVLALAGLSLTIGLFTRGAAVVVWAAITWLFLMEQALYLNHHYLMCLLAFLLAVVPCGRAAACDNLLRRRPAATVPFWSVALLRSQLLVLYFFAGVAKLNTDWLQGAPLDLWLAEHADIPWVGSYLGQRWVIVAVAWGGLVFDLSIGFLLVWRRTRPIALVLAGGFHACNHFWFDIGVFPFLAFGATWIFCEPDWPRRLAATVYKRPDIEIRGTPSPTGPLRELSRRATALLLAWVVVQCLLPLRHWLYPGRVDWTEEGHQFSWRMMLRDKAYRLNAITVVPRSTWPDLNSPPTPDDTEVSARTIWTLQPVADPLPPLFPLPLPLQSALSPAWAAAVEAGELDQFAAESLTSEERRWLGLNVGDGSPRGTDFTASGGQADEVGIDRVLTHRALFIFAQDAQRHAATQDPMDPARGARIRFQSKAGPILSAAGIDLPDEEIDRLLAGFVAYHRLRLASFQAGTMLTRPEMIREYAHHVADCLAAVWGVPPEVHIDVEASLNLRPFSPLIDVHTDLAAQPYSLAPADWIAPLTASLPSFDERRRLRQSLLDSGYAPN